MAGGSLDSTVAIRALEASRNGACEFKLTALFDDVGVDPADGELGMTKKIQILLEKYECTCDPELAVGNFDTPRVLKPVSQSRMDWTAVSAEIEKGEHSQQEFKASFYFDYKRAEREKSAKGNDLKSKDVRDSALKAIAGMLNSSGGILYIGVRNDGEAIGIEADYEFLPKDKRDPDGWGLELRNQVVNRFLNGKHVLPYVQVMVIDSGSGFVARIFVLGKSRLSFLKDDNDKPRLYYRASNSTEEVTIESVEDFLAKRWNVDAG